MTDMLLPNRMHCIFINFLTSLSWLRRDGSVIRTQAMLLPADQHGARLLAASAGGPRHHPAQNRPPTLRLSDWVLVVALAALCV